MSKADAKKFFELVNKDANVQKDLQHAYDHVASVAKKHGLDFTREEYFDHLHEHTGMTKVGTSDSDEHDETNTCFAVTLSEPPRS